MVRLFKPGDWVQLKIGGPVMKVIRYCPQPTKRFTSRENNYKVLCSCYDSQGGHQEHIYHQNSLIKVNMPVLSKIICKKKY